jgi:hypothetical protein
VLEAKSTTCHAYWQKKVLGDKNGGRAIASVHGNGRRLQQALDGEHETSNFAEASF